MDTLFLTGSSGGLGRVIRSYYLDRGWNVCGFDGFDDNFKAERFEFYKINSTDETSVARAFADAAKKFSTLSQLIATIGGLKPWAYADEMPLEDFQFVLNLNITSTFICTKEALKLMKPNHNGSIVTIGAETALHPDPKKTAYVAAKAAVIAFTQTVALETKDYGVAANCIVPTVIHTKANEEWGSPEEIVKWTKPEDIAALCFYLASESGKAINGAVLRIPNKM
ncbi:MAG TPA: SDR family NAD(P)-dependent oxidoreductase [Candidatus Kapabacteria bacterium]|nr:SDR family NAD(P)-dependent oxidoreductase [Candidatus Kapabacteria bacterium]